MSYTFFHFSVQFRFGSYLIECAGALPYPLIKIGPYNVTTKRNDQNCIIDFDETMMGMCDCHDSLPTTRLAQR
jgi:hypothetical protein